MGALWRFWLPLRFAAGSRGCELLKLQGKFASNKNQAKPVGRKRGQRHDVSWTAVAEDTDPTPVANSWAVSRFTFHFAFVSLFPPVTRALLTKEKTRMPTEAVCTTASKPRCEPSPIAALRGHNDVQHEGLLCFVCVYDSLLHFYLENCRPTTLTKSTGAQPVGKSNLHRRSSVWRDTTTQP